MPFIYDSENEVVTVELGNGDVEVDARWLDGAPKEVVLSDLGQSCPVGKSLRECDLGEPTSRFVKIGGSYEGLRTFALALLQVLAYHDHSAELPMTLRVCATCGKKATEVEKMADTGQFMMCSECVDKLHKEVACERG